eukprot:bmy_00195T0
MLRLFLTDVTISLLLLLLEQNLDPSSPTHVDFVGSYLQAGWTSSLMLEMCLLKRHPLARPADSGSVLLAGFLKELERSNCISLKTVPGSGSLLWVAGIYSCLVVELCCSWGSKVAQASSDLVTRLILMVLLLEGCSLGFFSVSRAVLAAASAKKTKRERDSQGLFLSDISSSTLVPTQTLPSFNSESTETGLLRGNDQGSSRSYGYPWPAGTPQVLPQTPGTPLSEAGSLPIAIPHLPPFSFGRKPPLRPRTEEPCLVRDSWGQGHCPVPYQPQGEGVWLEDWNLNAVVSDFVTFLLGSVNPPFPLLSMCASSPLSWALPFHTPAWAVLLFKCEEIPLCARTCKKLTINTIFCVHQSSDFFAWDPSPEHRLSGHQRLNPYSHGLHLA